MSVRTELAAILAAGLPEWDVRASIANVDGIEIPTLLVWPAELSPGPTLGTRTHELRVRLLTPVTDADAADDDLDELLPELLRLIEQHDPLTWTTAERGTHGEDYHAWTITVRVPARKE